MPVQDPRPPTPRKSKTPVSTGKKTSDKSKNQVKKGK
jgi:hypothetical protein